MADYAVFKGGVSSGGEESYGYHEIMSMMHGLQPEQVYAAGEACHYLTSALDALRDGVMKAASHVAEGGEWQGMAAGAAMRHLQGLHDQTAQLSAQAQTSGNTLKWLGGDVMPSFQSIPNPTVASKTEQEISSFLHGHSVNGKAAADAAAQNYLKTFNGHLATANEAMPSSLSAPYRESSSWLTPSAGHTGSGGGSGPGAGSSAYAGVHGSSSPVGGGASGYASPPAGANPFSSAKLPHGGAGATASLQGYTPSAGGATGSPFASPSTGPVASGGGVNPFSRMPVVPGPGGITGRQNDVLPHEDPVENKVPPEDPAAAEGAAGADAAGAEAAGAEGGSSGMPMGGGGGGGGQDKERQRQAWMHEDESIWGAPEGSVGSVLE